MATRIASARIPARYVVSRKFSSSGKILSEEEKAAENVYIKKMEKERMEKLARMGPSAGETPAAGGGAGTVAADAKPTGGQTSSAPPKVSTDRNRNYAVLAGVATIAAAAGWYLASPKTKEEVQD